MRNFENWKNFMIILLNVKRTATDKFFGRICVLEARYCSMKYENFRPVQLPLKINTLFFRKFFQRSMPRSDELSFLCNVSLIFPPNHWILRIETIFYWIQRFYSRLSRLFFIEGIQDRSSLSSPFGLCEVTPPEFVFVSGRFGLGGWFA